VEFWPILELEKDKTYRLHMTAMDYNHGFSLQPANINIQLVPGFEHVVTVTPNQSGTYGRWCATNTAASATTDGQPPVRQVRETGMMPWQPPTVPARVRACSSRSQAEMLMKAQRLRGVVWLLIGGLLAIGVVLTRWPAVHWLEADTFYMVLTAHGIDMLIFWIIFFESRGPVLLPHRPCCAVDRHATIAWLGLRADADRLRAEQRGGVPRRSSVMMTSPTCR
jgi:predicted nucleic acid-binding Zn ribbon protein